MTTRAATGRAPPHAQPAAHNRPTAHAHTPEGQTHMTITAHNRIKALPELAQGIAAALDAELTRINAATAWSDTYKAEQATKAKARAADALAHLRGALETARAALDAYCMTGHPTRARARVAHQHSPCACQDPPGREARGGLAVRCSGGYPRLASASAAMASRITSAASRVTVTSSPTSRPDPLRIGSRLRITADSPSRPMS